MTMTPGFRKFTLTAHVTSTVGWLGAVAAFLALAVASLTSQAPQTVQAADVAMGLIAWYVILPLSLASLLTGLVQALGTPWGLFRHYWVLAKLLLTLLATIVLLLKMEPISYLAGAAAEGTLSSADLAGLRVSLMAHAGGGLLVLLAATTLAVYKPHGITPYGGRKQCEENASDHDGLGSGVGSTARTPRWVKVFGLISIILVVLVGVMMLIGRHGPGVHSH
jgi:hypothetical protein